MSYNKCIFHGNLTRDPQAGTSANGIPYCHFGIAVNSYKDENTLFINCTAFHKQAEIIAKYFAKGQAIIISGKLALREYEKAGRKFTSLELTVEDFDFCGSKKDEDAPARPAEAQPTGAAAEVAEMFNGSEVPF